MATMHKNFAGMKYRPEMRNICSRVHYNAHDGQGYYCGFDTLDDFIKGYWLFLERNPYDGWKNFANNASSFIDFIAPIWDETNPNYAAQVKGIVDEAGELLGQVGGQVNVANNNGTIASPYEVKFYDGDYQPRQEAANRDGCIAYVEHHFNSGGGNYAVSVVGKNSSETSRNWGRYYAHSVASTFNIDAYKGSPSEDGIKIGGFGGRGDYNLRFTRMPAILLEPLFCDNPSHAALIRSSSGQSKLADILAKSIQRMFPQGGLIGFSIGHKGKTSSPNDRGAAVLGGGYEADYAEPVLEEARDLLESSDVLASATSRMIRIRANGQVVFEREVDYEAEIVWDGERETLEIG